MSFQDKLQARYVVAQAQHQGLQQLADFALLLDDEWSKNEELEWSDAEELVQQCRQVKAKAGPATARLIVEILQHARRQDWDSGEVAGWPERLLAALKQDGVSPA